MTLRAVIGDGLVTVSGTLTWLLLAGTLPGVIAGSVIRVYLLPGPVVFDFVVAAVMIPLGGFLLLTPAAPASTGCPARSSGSSRRPRGVSAGSTASAADRFWRRS